MISLPLSWWIAVGAVCAALAVGGVQSWRLDRCQSAARDLSAEHAALVAAANRQSAAVEELERTAQARLADARRITQAGKLRAQAMDAQAAAMRNAQAESCEAAVKIVRDSLR
jgi:hypothetical protein